VSLKHPTIEKYRFSVETQDMTGAGDLTGSTRELDFHARGCDVEEEVA
jgi:hypothetical protein